MYHFFSSSLDLKGVTELVSISIESRGISIIGIEVILPIIIRGWNSLPAEIKDSRQCVDFSDSLICYSEIKTRRDLSEKIKNLAEQIFKRCEIIDSVCEEIDFNCETFNY